MNEIWKDIPEYEGLYQVSNLGQFKRLERTDTQGRVWPELIMKKRQTPNGYFQAGLRKPNGKQFMASVHRSVLLAFVGPSDKTVDHLNRDKSDNRLSNLQYVTINENIKRYHESLDTETSKRCGVKFKKKKNQWTSEIFIDGKFFWLGTYKTEADAILARDKAEINTGLFV